MKELGCLYTVSRIVRPFGSSGLAKYGCDMAEDQGLRPTISRGEVLALKALDFARTAILLVGVGAAILNDKPLLAIIPPILYVAIGYLEMTTVYSAIGKSQK